MGCARTVLHIPIWKALRSSRPSARNSLCSPRFMPARPARPPAPPQTLHLTPQQKQQLLLQRQAHLTLMRRICQQRQQLNMQARTGVLPIWHSVAAWCSLADIASWTGSRPHPIPPPTHLSLLHAHCLRRSLPTLPTQQAMSLMLLGQQGAAAAAAGPSSGDQGAAAPNSPTAKLATVLKLVKVSLGAAPC